jgi:hypothetical protein
LAIGAIHAVQTDAWRYHPPYGGSDRGITASFEEVVRYNMLLTEAIFELLAERSVLSGAEVLERVKKLKKEATVTFHRTQ